MYIVLSTTLPSPQKSEEICRDIISDYQWHKVCMILLLFF